MAYIGKQPIVGNFVKLDAITTSATATYNLLNGGVAYFPQTANNCIVSLNGVIQSPTSAYTISGSTIVFDSALTASDSIDFILVLGDVLSIGTPSDATVTNAKLALTAGSAGTPAISIAADTNTGIFFPAADTIAFTEGGTEAMRIDSDGDVGIGLSTPACKLDIYNSAAAAANNEILRLRYNTSTTPGHSGDLNFTNAAGTVVNRIASVIRDSINVDLVFSCFSSSLGERMRITSGGDTLVGKTSNTLSVQGIALGANGIAELTATASRALDINRLTDDGDLVRLLQATSVEGTISVSGATVTYGGFTGTHWSRFIDNSKPDVLRGTVMESLDQMTDWYAVEFEVSTTENNEVKTHTEHKPYALKANEQEGDIITYNFEGTDYQATIVKEVDVKHVMSKISNTVEAKNVYGVFHAWDNDDLINNDFYVASVGSYVVRIKAGQTVSKGDLLQSNGDGTAKVQADDLVRASSFAKVLSNTVIDTYEDGSFIVPCSLMC
jgi:hypothetical protein